jgi:hypothetical protein
VYVNKTSRDGIGITSYTTVEQGTHGTRHKGDMEHSALHRACEFGDVTELRSMIATGMIPDIEKRTAGGSSYLHLATASLGSSAVQCLEMLIAAKADVEAKEFGGKTPLYW